MKTSPYIVVGLGNPGGEYQGTRHNIGFMVVEAFRQAHDLPDWQEDKRRKALISRGMVNHREVLLLQPQTFMNKSGEALRGLLKSKREIEQLWVIHDDLDLPLGRSKLSFNRGAGGHHGVESIIKVVKTKNFGRIRVGIATTPGGKIKKPNTEQQVVSWILGRFSTQQLVTLKPIIKKLLEALVVILTEGREPAMSRYN